MQLSSLFVTLVAATMVSSPVSACKCLDPNYGNPDFDYSASCCEGQYDYSANDCPWTYAQYFIDAFRACCNANGLNYDC
jgi:hypothetical protein